MKPNYPFGPRLGELVRFLRIASGQTQQDIAGALDCSREYVSQIERGERALPLMHWVSLVHKLALGTRREDDVEPLWVLCLFVGGAPIPLVGPDGSHLLFGAEGERGYRVTNVLRAVGYTEVEALPIWSTMVIDDGDDPALPELMRPRNSHCNYVDFEFGWEPSERKARADDALRLASALLPSCEFLVANQRTVTT